MILLINAIYCREDEHFTGKPGGNGQAGKRYQYYNKTYRRGRIFKAEAFVIVHIFGAGYIGEIAGQRQCAYIGYAVH